MIIVRTSCGCCCVITWAIYAAHGEPEQVDLIEAEGTDEGDGVARHLLDGRRRGPAGGAATREVFTAELLAIAEDIAARLDSIDAEAARTDALGLFAMMIGTLQLARAPTDRDLSDQLLARGVETALRLLPLNASRAPEDLDAEGSG